jgi:hypothetical protein
MNAMTVNMLERAVASMTGTVMARKAKSQELSSPWTSATMRSDMALG